MQHVLEADEDQGDENPMLHVSLEEDQAFNPKPGHDRSCYVSMGPLRLPELAFSVQKL